MGDEGCSWPSNLNPAVRSRSDYPRDHNGKAIVRRRLFALVGGTLPLAVFDHVESVRISFGRIHLAVGGFFERDQGNPYADGLDRRDQSASGRFGCAYISIGTRRRPLPTPFASRTTELHRRISHRIEQRKAITLSAEDLDMFVTMGGYDAISKYTADWVRQLAEDRIAVDRAEQAEALEAAYLAKYPKPSPNSEVEAARKLAWEMTQPKRRRPK